MPLIKYFCCIPTLADILVLDTTFDRMALRRKKSRFVVKHWENLLQDLERASHRDVATKAIDGLLSGVQLEIYNSVNRERILLKIY